jgi:hypothetical protein
MNGSDVEFYEPYLEYRFNRYVKLMKTGMTSIDYFRSIYKNEGMTHE